MGEIISILLNKLKKYHLETYEHSLRVATLSLRLADINLYNSEDKSLIYKTGLVHDIGKLNVPLSLLTKKESLTLEEKEIVNTHVRKGCLILDSDYYNQIRQIMVRHHEFSLNPYPRGGLERRNIQRKSERREDNEKFSTLGQILALCDMYDALIRPRSYKTALSKEEVKSILENEFIGDNKFLSQITRI